MLMQCRDLLCQASFHVCNTCSTLNVTQAPVRITKQMVLLHRVTELIANLNTAPAYALPPWVVPHVVPGAPVGDPHMATSLWDNCCRNLAGSALMLMMLRPLFFGMPWMAPLRIFGVPPPKVLLDLDGPVADSAVSRDWTNDFNRAICVKGLLEHFRHSGDSVRASAVQDCLDSMKQIIVHKEWSDSEACQIARQSLFVEL